MGDGGKGYCLGGGGDATYDWVRVHTGDKMERMRVDRLTL